MEEQTLVSKVVSSRHAKNLHPTKEKAPKVNAHGPVGLLEVGLLTQPPYYDIAWKYLASSILYQF